LPPGQPHTNHTWAQQTLKSHQVCRYLHRCMKLKCATSDANLRLKACCFGEAFEAEVDLTRSSKMLELWNRWSLDTNQRLHLAGGRLRVSVRQDPLPSYELWRGLMHLRRQHWLQKGAVTA
jgi:hypothetical protein